MNEQKHNTWRVWKIQICFFILKKRERSGMSLSDAGMMGNGAKSGAREYEKGTCCEMNYDSLQMKFICNSLHCACVSTTNHILGIRLALIKYIHRNIHISIS